MLISTSEAQQREAPNVMVDDIQSPRAFPSDSAISDGSGSLGEWSCADGSRTKHIRILLPLMKSLTYDLPTKLGCHYSDMHSWIPLR